MTRAIIAAFGVEYLDIAALLRDVMVQTAPEHRPDLYPIDPAAVVWLLCAAVPGGSPGMQQVKNAIASLGPADHRRAVRRRAAACPADPV